MNIKKISTLRKKLISEGLKVEDITLYNVSGKVGNVPALCIDTNYKGLYPSKETWNQIEKVEKICGKNFHHETRGYYTAVYVWEV